MTTKQFDKMVIELYGPVLTERGFETKNSSTFYRKVRNDVFHVILADPFKGGNYYDIKVFACSPKIEPLFETTFPDDLGIPSDSFCYLSDLGIDSIVRIQKFFRGTLTLKWSPLCCQ